MLNKLEFDDFKKVRKTLLIFSLFGIFIKILLKKSIGDFQFFGFTIPIEDSAFIPEFISAIIFYFLIALIVRYSSEKFFKNYEKEFRKKKIEGVKDFSKFEKDNDELHRYLYDTVMTERKKILRKSVYFLDVIFPIILGVVSILIIFLY